MFYLLTIQTMPFLWLFTAREVDTKIDAIHTKNKETTQTIQEAKSTMLIEILLEKMDIKDFVRKYKNFFIYLDEEHRHALLKKIFWSDAEVHIKKICKEDYTLVSTDVLWSNIPKPWEPDFDVVNVLVYKDNFNVYLYLNPHIEVKICPCCACNRYWERDSVEACFGCGYGV